MQNTQSPVTSVLIKVWNQDFFQMPDELFLEANKFLYKFGWNPHQFICKKYTSPNPQPPFFPVRCYNQMEVFVAMTSHRHILHGGLRNPMKCLCTVYIQMYKWQILHLTVQQAGTGTFYHPYVDKPWVLFMIAPQFEEDKALIWAFRLYVSPRVRLWVLFCPLYAHVYPFLF